MQEHNVRSKLLFDVAIVVASGNYLDFPQRILELGYFPKRSASRGLIWSPLLCVISKASPSHPQVTLPFSAPQGAPPLPLPPTPSVLLLNGLAQSQGCRSTQRSAEGRTGAGKGLRAPPHLGLLLLSQACGLVVTS